MKRCLVYHVGSIGDTLVAMPSFAALKKQYPDCRFDLLNLSIVRNRVHAELYGNDDLFEHKTFLLPPENKWGKLQLYFDFLRAVRREKYDALTCFSPDVPRVLTKCFRMFCGGTIHHAFLTPEMGDIPLWQAYFRALDLPEEEYTFPLTPEELEQGSRAAASLETPLFAFGIGGNQQACRYPLERYEALIADLKKNGSFTPVWLGGEADLPAMERMQKICGGILFRGTLRETIAFLRQCRCYIGNDTGSLHLAAAAGIPCAVIGSAHNVPPHMWHPMGDGHLVFRHEIACAGCEERICPKGDPAPCMTGHSPDRIRDEIEQWLNPTEMK